MYKVKNINKYNISCSIQLFYLMKKANITYILMYNSNMLIISIFIINESILYILIFYIFISYLFTINWFPINKDVL